MRISAVGIIYLVVGAIVAATHDYFENIDTLKHFPRSGGRPLAADPYQDQPASLDARRPGIWAVSERLQTLLEGAFPDARRRGRRPHGRGRPLSRDRGSARFMASRSSTSTAHLRRLPNRSRMTIHELRITTRGDA
jgi:hypothetical protein